MQDLAGYVSVVGHLSAHSLKLYDQDIRQVLQVVQFDGEDGVALLALDAVRACLLERHLVLVE